MSAYVLFFGGYKATVSNVKAWISSAIQQKPSVLFDAYPYPNGVSWKGAEAVKAFTGSRDYAAAIEKVSASKCDVVFIVGHSSGCAIANAVDAALKDHKKIRLIALDGYLPSDDQLGRPGTQVWVAHSSAGSSMHYIDLTASIDKYNGKAKSKIKINVHTAPANCSTKLALHFSLVNVSASDALVKDIPDGYKNCQANLAWLP